MVRTVLQADSFLFWYRPQYEVWNKSDLCTAADGRTAHLAAGAAGDGPQALLQSFRYVYGIQIPFCFWHMHTPFLFHRLIYSFLLCPKTTGGYGHLHPVPDERTFQSDFYTVQLQYFHLLLQALLRLPLLFPQKAPG